MPQSLSSQRTASPFDSGNADAVVASTMSTVRQIAGLSSRERLRRDQERKLRQLPFLYRRVQELQDTCERLEDELASSHQQVFAFQQEMFALRSLIKFTEHPELVAAAQEDAARRLLQEEVEELRRLVQRLQREKALSLLQCEEACEAAELYKQLYDQLYEESMRTVETGAGGGPTSGVESVARPLPNRRVGVATLATSPAPSTVASIEEQVTQLHGVLKLERARSLVLEETVHVLQPAMTETSDTDIKRCVPAPNRSPRSSERRREDQTSGIHASQRRVFPDETHRRASRLKRLVAVLRSENRLLTQRVGEVVARNMRCVKDIAALKLDNKRLALQRGTES
ncbi:hypothetical protein GH5_01183 [Leishmania sp. Ghana 2012 LV757]|uniref:hypothetical protein n=1 Tax=Leishmania sp. Ghana 2012 LV757 TaxID=2803181 RepID=UPI001B6E0F32|nr:hypothetical protein GH5_01183 [Leishmania sp. Ghana 2012 LV757]